MSLVVSRARLTNASCRRTRASKRELCAARCRCDDDADDDDAADDDAAADVDDDVAAEIA